MLGHLEAGDLRGSVELIELAASETAGLRRHTTIDALGLFNHRGIRKSYLL
jgi:hypothetical protein